MAYRALVFILAVLAAIGTAFFVRQGERGAVAANHVWPGVTERRAQDVLTATQPATPLDPDVVIVSADDASVAKYGAVSGWGRDVWATAVRHVVAGGPRAVVMDVALDQRTKDRPDEAMWRATEAGGRKAVLGFGYDAARTKWTPDDVRSLRYLERYALADRVVLHDAAATTVWDWPHFRPPVSDFTEAARGVGVFLRETDPDGVLRDARLLYRTKVTPPPAVTAPLPKSLPGSPLNGYDVVLPSLAVAGAQAAFGLDKTALRVDGDSFRFATAPGQKPVQIPLDHGGRMTVRYAQPAGPNVISFADVASGNAGAALFKGKTVIFGVTAANTPLTDTRHTPRGDMPRVLITASAVSSILARNYVARADGRDVVATLVLVSLVAGLLLPRSRPAMVFVTGLCLAVVYFVVAWGALAFAGVLLPVLPVLTVLGIATVLALAAALVLEAQRSPGSVQV